MCIKSLAKVIGGGFAIGIGAGIVFGTGWVGWTVALVGGGLWGIHCALEEEKQTNEAVHQAVKEALKFKRPIIVDGGRLEYKPA